MEALEPPPANISEFSFTGIELPEPAIEPSSIVPELAENPPMCCVLGKCAACCTTLTCSDPSLYPIIFLHGHSVSKSKSPEFSLDVFNKLQHGMQADGYINAGVVSPYSDPAGFAPGGCGRSGSPITVKASYYYDAYYNVTDYIIVPQTSENIDTTPSGSRISWT